MGIGRIGQPAVVTLEAAGGRCQGYPCHQRAAGLVTTGCVHEHVYTMPLCGLCLAQMRKLIPDRGWVCGPCLVSPQRPHQCQVAELRWEPADGAG